MTPPLLIFIGGSDESNGDYSAMKDMAETGGTARWSGLKTAKPGDRVLIYVGHPHFAIVAAATVLGTPKKGRPGDYPYRVKTGKFRWLNRPISLEQLRKKFPQWRWHRYPRAKLTVPDEVARRLWSMAKRAISARPEKRRSQVLLCSEYDFVRLRESDGGEGGRLRCLKQTRSGDRIFLYCYSPVQAIVGFGEAASDAEPVRPDHYETTIERILWLEKPIALATMRERLPSWKWLRFCQTRCYLDHRKETLLDDLAGEMLPISKGAARRSWNGAGFGSSESNKLVERAAVGRITRELRRAGYSVRSRERERIGYDLEATKKRSTIHVEVKGISGPALQFPITAGEVSRAKEDPDFELWAVTNARSRNAAVHRYCGADLVTKFDLNPTAYVAARKAIR